MLWGIWARPTNALRLSFDADLFWADSSFVRPDPRQQQRYRFQGSYAPATWISLDASFDILEHRNNIALVNDKEHDRGYSFSAVLTPDERFSFDLGYTYSDIYAQLIECWSYGSGVTFPVAPGLLPPRDHYDPLPSTRRAAGRRRYRFWRSGDVQQQNTFRLQRRHVETH